MPLPIRLDGLLAKIEGTYGTDSVPVVGTDAVRVNERLWPKLQEGYAWRNRRDEAANGSLVPPPPAAARGRIISLDFLWELKGSRTGAAYAAGNKIEASPLLQSCMASETLVTTGGSESLAYAHADSSHSSCSIYAYASGYLYKIVGCRGVWSWPISVGVLTNLRFQMQGLLASKTVAALPGGFTYATPSPLAGVNLAMSIGGVWSPDVLTASFEPQGTTALQRLDSGNAVDGVQSFDIGATMQPLFKISAKAVNSAYDPSVDLAANPTTVRTLTMQYGTVQYNKARLTSNLYITDPIRNSDQNGFAGWDLEYLSDVSWALLFN